ncbi:hypothetical protein NC651_002761 [Populus alba x Populus x berolinensis]|nr:hypothetical protein NC651_002761 [Populus alba x Populus x berolinensis]
MSVLIPIYEFVAVPFARKITGHPSGITPLQRVGVGLVLSILSMAVAGSIELYRKQRSTRIHQTKSVFFGFPSNMAFLGSQTCSQLLDCWSFSTRKAPSGMRSVSASFTWLTLALGYFTSTVFTNSVTKRITPSKQGWLHGNDLNSNNLNLFYWFLAVLNVINFVFYLFSASWYKSDDRESETIAKAEKGPNGEITLVK